MNDEHVAGCANQICADAERLVDQAVALMKSQLGHDGRSDVLDVLIAVQEALNGDIEPLETIIGRMQM